MLKATEMYPETHRNPTCEYCNTTLDRTKAKRAKFCSLACSGKNRRQRSELVCQQCGTAFYPKPARARKTIRFCSQECRRTWGFSPHRFWDRVTRGNECWLWQGPLEDGYGRLRWGSRRMERAHRVAWILTHGNIPPGMYVLHSCDMRSCVNPAHLFLGDSLTNMRDRNRKERQARGERVGSAKLTAKQVRQLRHRYAAGDISMARLAQLFGISRGYVWALVRRRNWQHI